MIESLVEPPDCHLVHYGKKEVLACIQAMEAEYDVPMAYVDPGPAIPGAAPTSNPDEPWGEGITVVGPAQPLRETYGLPDPNTRFPQAFSYKQYCRNVLDRHFWGDAVILYAISCLWLLKITVVNSQTLQQYRVRHSAPLKNADLELVFNSSSHYTAAGRYSQS